MFFASCWLSTFTVIDDPFWKIYIFSSFSIYLCAMAFFDQLNLSLTWDIERPSRPLLFFQMLRFMMNK